ncbi:uncharacterized protein LOC108952564 [Musa acuminata AAA Group]|uniref:uncharacterized protein LOC108952564 n=1 Tax=Musa acuminata AAA Group TaxID=214697 RepID=UPI0031DA182D
MIGYIGPFVVARKEINVTGKQTGRRKKVHSPQAKVRFLPAVTRPAFLSWGFISPPNSIALFDRILRRCSLLQPDAHGGATNKPAAAPSWWTAGKHATMHEVGINAIEEGCLTSNNFSAALVNKLQLHLSWNGSTYYVLCPELIRMTGGTWQTFPRAPKQICHVKKSDDAYFFLVR